MQLTQSKTRYQAVIGLEVHAQLSTKSKIFSTDSNSFGKDPNTNISIISLGHPGSMPLLNKKVVEYAIRMGLACNCDITRFCYFDRKNYFYPDLPKGYQITQDKTPICKGGYVPVKTEKGEIRVLLHKIHMEEDAGKSIHVDGVSESLIDLNRSGVPLIEIVTEPCMHSSEEAAAFLAEIRQIVRYLGICDGNMEEGSLRCDANVSVMPEGSKTLGKKVEVKNMNSIRNVARAIDHEIERQIDLLEDGHLILSETRTFDVSSGRTFGMRTKEELNDYRYFPEPDLSPLKITEEWLNQIKKEMPLLPRQLREQLVREYELSEHDAAVLTDQREVVEFYMDVCKYTRNKKAAANWMKGPVKSYLNEHNLNITNFPLSPEQIAEIIRLLDDGEINFTAANQKLFPYLIEHGDCSVIEAAEELGIYHDSDEDSIQPIIEEVLASMPDKVQEYKSGKKGLLGLFMGEVMKKTQGKVDPKVANTILREKLESNQKIK